MEWKNHLKCKHTDLLKLSSEHLISYPSYKVWNREDLRDKSVPSHHESHSTLHLHTRQSCFWPQVSLVLTPRWLLLFPVRLPSRIMVSSRNGSLIISTLGIPVISWFFQLEYLVYKKVQGHTQRATFGEHPCGDSLRKVQIIQLDSFWRSCWFVTEKKL